MAERGPDFGRQDDEDALDRLERGPVANVAGAASRICAEAIRRLQDQSTILARLQFELEAHLKDVASPLGDFRRLVMDPEQGLVAKQRALQAAVVSLESAVMGAEKGDSIYSVRRRVKDLEDQRAGDSEGRRWRLGTVVIPLVAGLGGAILGAALAAWFGGS